MKNDIKIIIIVMVAVLVALISVIIGVRGQEAVVWKRVAIEEFEFKNKTVSILFIETEKEKFEIRLTPEQKNELIDILKKKIESMKLELSKQ